jgi:hypothetical protein
VISDSFPSQFGVQEIPRAREDKQQAKECGENVATFRSEKSRDQIAKELRGILDLQRGPRIYIIGLQEGGRFFFGKRKVAPWAGYAQTSVDSDEET